MWCGAAMPRCALALVAALLVLVGAPRTAEAHAILLSIDPANGEVVEDSPGTIAVTFTETVRVDDDAVTLLDDTGASVAVDVEVVGDELRISPTSPLDDGTYVVSWRVISIDSHPVSGGSVFHVGAATLDDVVIDRAASPTGLGALRALADALVYGTALVSVGASWFARRWSAPAISAVVRRAALAGLGALVIATAARVGEFDGSWSGIANLDGWSGALDGAVGLLAVCVGTGLVVLASTGPAGRGAVGRWAVGAGAVLVGLVVEGHTRSADSDGVAALGGVVHLAAGSLWLGGVAALVIGRRRELADSQRWRAAVVDVSAVAIWAVVAVAAGGTALAVTIAPDLGAQLWSRWGVLLLVKVILVIGLVGLGWYHRARVIPRLEVADVDVGADGVDARFRRSLGAELALFAGVVAVTGVLVSSPPEAAAIVEPQVVSADPVSELVELSSGVGSARIVVTPAALGANEVFVTLTDLAGAPLELVWDPIIEAAAPDLGVGPLVLPPHRLGDGSYHALVDLALTGRWEITVQARTGTFESGRATVHLTLD